MSASAWWKTVTGRRPELRRVSPERARLVARQRRTLPIPEAGEKLVLTFLFGALLTVLVGAGAGLTGAGWLAVASLIGLGLAFFLRYQLEYRRAALGPLSRDLMLASFLLLNVLGLRALWTIDADLLLFSPLAFSSLVLALAWNRAFAIESLLFVCAVFGLFLLLRGDALPPAAVPGLAVALAGGLAAALLAAGVRRRSTLVRIGFATGAVQALVCASFVLLGHAPDGGPNAFGADVSGPSSPLRPLGTGAFGLVWKDALLVGLEGIAIGLVVTGILPAIEGLFRTTTDVSLLELGNTQEQPLLRKLLIEAPGTFHHSYVVGLIAESAAESVGANALLARVGALYHDIGKLNKPDYFAENSTDARERHRVLTPEMSNLVISSHTRDGVELGAYHGLPQAILDFMTEHHGTSCMEYFYQRARDLRGAENVSEEAFRYPGPRPQRIETAIVMIADAIEAIGRQMPDPTLERLREMVHEVCMKRLLDDQFDDCNMTLRELSRIEEACTQVLAGIHHTRPTYPKGRPHPLDLSQPRAQRETTGASASGAAAPQGRGRGASAAAGERR